VTVFLAGVEVKEKTLFRQGKSAIGKCKRIF